jgi:hypothetical protein
MAAIAISNCGLQWESDVDPLFVMLLLSLIPLAIWIAYDWFSNTPAKSDPADGE